MSPGEFERLRHPWESLADWGGTVEMPVTGNGPYGSAQHVGRPWHSSGPPPGARRRGAAVVLAAAGQAGLVLVALAVGGAALLAIAMTAGS